MLRYTNANGRSHIPLALLRERPVNLADTELLGGPFPIPLDHTFGSETIYWIPQVKVDENARVCASLPS